MEIFRSVMSLLPGCYSCFGGNLKTTALICGIFIVPIQLYYIIAIDRHYYEDFRDFELLFGTYVVSSKAWLVSFYFDITLTVFAVSLVLSILQSINIGVPLFVFVHLACCIHHAVHWCMFLYGWHKRNQQNHWWSDESSEKTTLDYINYMLILWLAINLVFLSLINSYFVHMNEF